MISITGNSISFNQQPKSINYYGVCTTGGDVAVKVVTIDGFELNVGTVLFVKFTNNNTASNIQLKINQFDSYRIIGSSELITDTLYQFVFDGVCFHLMQSSGSSSTTSNYFGAPDWNTYTQINGTSFTAPTNGLVVGIGDSVGGKNTNLSLYVNSHLADYFNQPDEGYGPHRDSVQTIVRKGDYVSWNNGNLKVYFVSCV